MFHALNGLPSEFNSFNTAIRTRAEPLKLEELASFLTTEEMHISKVQSQGSMSVESTFVFVAAQGSGKSSNTAPTHMPSGNNNSFLNAYGMSNFHKGGRSYNKSRGKENKGGAWFNNGSKNACQICGKTNHIAANCYHRLNLDYQSPSFQSQNPFYGPRSPNPFYGPRNPNPSSGHPSYPITSPPQHSTPPLQSRPQAYFTPQQSYSQSSPNWYFDSGATSHITNDLSNLTLQQPYSSSDGVVVGNGSTLPISHSGQGILPTPSQHFLLSNMFHVPAISHNLLSVYQFAKDNNCKLIFNSSGYTIQDNNTNQTLHQGPCHKGLYPLHTCSNFSTKSALVSSTATSMLWHQRLGHPSPSLFNNVVKQFHLPTTYSLQFNCYQCNMAKSHKLPFSPSLSVSHSPFDLLHMDVWGPAPVSSFQGFRYYLLIMDDYTKFVWVFPLHYKSQVATAISNFHSYVSTQFGVSIKTFRSDNGGEFINHYLSHLFSSFGILHQTSCPYTPEQNGSAERKHRHLMETTLTMLHQANLPYQF